MEVRHAAAELDVLHGEGRWACGGAAEELQVDVHHVRAGQGWVRVRHVCLGRYLEGRGDVAAVRHRADAEVVGQVGAVCVRCDWCHGDEVGERQRRSRHGTCRGWHDWDLSWADVGPTQPDTVGDTCAICSLGPSLGPTLMPFDLKSQDCLGRR